MRTTRAGVALAGTLALGGLVGGVVLAPALATAATSEQSAASAVSDRVDRIAAALQGLVDDGTLTTEQRDEVADTLSRELPRGGPGAGRGPGHGLGPGHGGRPSLDVAASTLGMTEQELLTELRGGRSLADVADGAGVPVDDLTAALVQAAESRLAEAVASGRLTQEQADERAARMAERIAVAVERPGPGRGMRDGMGSDRGHGMGQGMGQGWGPGGRPGTPDQRD
jgi:hypothetical protein